MKGRDPKLPISLLDYTPSADRIQKLTDHHPTEEKISPSPSLPAISYFIPGTAGLGSALEVEGREGRERGIKHNGYNNGQEGGTGDDGGEKGRRRKDNYQCYLLQEISVVLQLRRGEHF